MPHLNLLMTVAGPIFDVVVAVSMPRKLALEKAGQPVPPPIKLRALLDTGASCTVIDPSVLSKLQVPATGTAAIQTPSTGGSAHTCNQFDILIAFMDAAGSPLFLSPSTPVIESVLVSQGIEALIGRDLLAKSVFTYNGAGGFFTLSY